VTARTLALIYLARHPGSTKKELAEAMEVSERTVANILTELTSMGAVRGSKGSGRRLH
jgi:DNA-binding IscR family transcriptional regulator